MKLTDEDLGKVSGGSSDFGVVSEVNDPLLINTGRDPGKSRMQNYYNLSITGDSDNTKSGTNEILNSNKALLDQGSFVIYDNGRSKIDSDGRLTHTFPSF